MIDVNCGCPIDLVFNKGGGSALLGHATKLGKSLVGMSQVLGEIPLTIKIRTGITASTPVAHKLVTKFQTEWGVSHVTVSSVSSPLELHHLKSSSQSCMVGLDNNVTKPKPIITVRFPHRQMQQICFLTNTN